MAGWVKTLATDQDGDCLSRPLFVLETLPRGGWGWLGGRRRGEEDGDSDARSAVAAMADSRRK